jgi:hypothetical protein
MGARPDVDAAVEQMIAAETLDWSRLGYVQLVKAHNELCSAVMLLADVHRLRSPAKRLLVFPRAWLKRSEEDGYDPEMATTRRLLRTAARRYGVSLVPIEPIIEGANGESAASELEPLAYRVHGGEELMVYGISRWIAMVVLPGEPVLTDGL